MAASSSAWSVASGQALQLAAQRRVGRVVAEGAAERDEGQLGAPQPPLLHLGQLEEERLALDRIRALGGAQLEHRRRSLAQAPVAA